MCRKIQKYQSKIEIIGHLLTSLGVITAIVFAIYQAIMLKNDFILKTRPFAKIDINHNFSLESKFFGITLKREKFVIYFDFKKDTSAELIFPLLISNIGESPLRIKNFKIKFYDSDAKKIFEEIFLEENKTHQYIIFPNEEMPINSIKFTPEGIWLTSSLEDKINTFNEIFEQLDKNLRKGAISCVADLTYTFFDEKLQNKIYATRKGWMINTDSQRAQIWHYDTK